MSNVSWRVAPTMSVMKAKEGLDHRSSQRPALGRASSFSSAWILAWLVGVFTGMNARADD